MIGFTLDAQFERVAPENPFPALKHPPLYHQWRTWKALQEFHLVVNTYNTGTGKTIASLLYLFDLNRQRKNVLFIAPTNALIAQHSADIRAFVEEAGLDYLVAEITAARLREIVEGERPGETLQRLIQNPQTFHEWFGIEKSDHRKRPIVLVVNPDIFYYAIYFRYRQHDQRNVFIQIIDLFSYIVIDEFHYYNSKQFANFLFYFMLIQQFGRFEVGQRICLLSATPTPTVVEFLQRTFGEQWTLISPDNEPPEAEGLPEIQTLTPLEVTIWTGEIQEWASAEQRTLASTLTAGEHGAIISSTLWRINESHAYLKSRLGETWLGRITGPEPEAKRAEATARALILATPTVDIGYNFKKLGKARQNIDFVVCDGRFTDELLQRLGRAGRVLGKKETTHPSRAALVLPSDLADMFRPLEGKGMSRGAFAQWLNNDSGIPTKHDLTAYIRRHAIMEAFYPLWKLNALLPPDLQPEIDDLYERLHAVFAPRAKLQPSWKPRTFFQRYQQRKKWLQDHRQKPPSNSKETAQMAVDWLAWAEALPYEERYKLADFLPYLPQFLQNQAKCEAVRDFVASQVTLTESLFSFRDSFSGPAAAVYDPEAFLSSERFNEYDLLHLLAYYDLQVMERDAFLRAGGEGEAECYVRLLRFREPKLTIGLLYEEDELEEKEWQKRYCRSPIALKGLRLIARARGLEGGGQVALPQEVVGLFRERFITALIVPPKDTGPMKGRLRGSTLYPRRLEVIFPDGTVNDEYHILLGTAAWLAEAELRTHFLLKARTECDAIIL